MAVACETTPQGSPDVAGAAREVKEVAVQTISRSHSRVKTGKPRARVPVSVSSDFVWVTESSGSKRSVSRGAETVAAAKSPTPALVVDTSVSSASSSSPILPAPACPPVPTQKRRENVARCVTLQRRMLREARSLDTLARLSLYDDSDPSTFPPIGIIPAPSVTPKLPKLRTVGSEAALKRPTAARVSRRVVMAPSYSHLRSFSEIGTVDDLPASTAEAMDELVRHLHEWRVSMVDEKKLVPPLPPIPDTPTQNMFVLDNREKDSTLVSRSPPKLPLPPPPPPPPPSAVCVICAHPRDSGECILAHPHSYSSYFDVYKHRARSGSDTIPVGYTERFLRLRGELLHDRDRETADAQELEKTEEREMTSSCSSLSEAAPSPRAPSPPPLIPSRADMPSPADTEWEFTGLRTPDDVVQGPIQTLEVPSSTEASRWSEDSRFVRKRPWWPPLPETEPGNVPPTPPPKDTPPTTPGSAGSSSNPLTNVARRLRLKSAPTMRFPTIRGRSRSASKPEISHTERE